MFLHEPGEDKDSFTREDLSSKNAESTQTSSSTGAPVAGPSRNTQAQTSAAFQKAPLPAAAAADPSGRHHSQGTLTSMEEEDGSALPSSASWANKGQQTQRSGPSSQADTSNAASPAIQNASVSTQKQPALGTSSTQSQSDRSSVDAPRKPLTTPARTKKLAQEPSKPHLLDDILRAVQSPAFRITFNESLFSEEEYQQILSFPPLFDDDGGKKRRAMRNRDEEERLARAEELTNTGPELDLEPDEQALGGSLQLGGEPEPSQIGRDQRHNPPQFMGTFGQQNSSLGNLTNLSINGRGLTQMQQQQLLQIKAGNSPNTAVDQLGTGAGGGSGFNQSSQLQSGLFPTQNQSQGHARQTSRYSFANDSAATTIKPSANPKAMAQQSAMMPPNNTTIQSFHSQNQHGNPPFSSLQGPPPGLKASGTPPISGGGMFGQSHGFTSAMGRNPGFGARNGGEKESHAELLRDLLHGRGGASTSGASQTSDSAKREFMFPSFLNQYSSTSTSPAPAPAPGLPLMYGSQALGYHDPGSQKHKKKGKRHRHANTSSSGGGGIVDLADPTILQARIQQQGGAGQGQGLYSGQGQGGYNPSGMMYGGGYGRW
jgi:CCR4-NOT transcription complex subunit 4